MAPKKSSPISFVVSGFKATWTLTTSAAAATWKIESLRSTPRRLAFSSVRLRLHATTGIPKARARADHEGKVTRLEHGAGHFGRADDEDLHTVRQERFGQGVFFQVGLVEDFKARFCQGTAAGFLELVGDENFHEERDSKSRESAAH